MRVIRDKDIADYLDQVLTKKSILEQFQPTLLTGLKTCQTDSDKIIPPRVSQTSNKKDLDLFHLFMPCISPNEVGIKLISGGLSNNAKGLGLQGSVVLLDENTGVTKAILNAATLTAFRTALASTTGLTKVIRPDSDILPEVSVFGVGAQAYWHIKLALILYESKITTVNVINRTLKNAEILVEKLEQEYSNIQFNAFSYEQESSELASHVQNSSLIFGCLPSTQTTIKKSYINEDPKYPKFISLIGSYKPHMYELDLEYVKSELKDKVKILVDSKEHTLIEAGELIQTGITADGLIDLADLYSEEIDPSTYTTPANVTVQKLVGLAIMDLSIGNYIADHIEGGVVVDDF